MVTAKREAEGFESAPDGLPAGFTVGLATEEAAVPSQSPHEFLHRVDRSRPTCDLARYFHPFQLHQFFAGVCGA